MTEVDEEKTYSVGALSEMFGVSRQAIHQRVKKLDDDMKFKNSKGSWYINEKGLRQLMSIYVGSVDKEVDVNASINDNQHVDERISLLERMLESKEKEIERLAKQLDQQQQLTAMSLQENRQLQLDYTQTYERLEEEIKKSWWKKLFGK